MATPHQGHFKPHSASTPYAWDDNHPTAPPQSSYHATQHFNVQPTQPQRLTAYSRIQFQEPEPVYYRHSAVNDYPTSPRQSLRHLTAPSRLSSHEPEPVYYRHSAVNDYPTSPRRSLRHPNAPSRVQFQEPEPVFPRHSAVNDYSVTPRHALRHPYSMDEPKSAFQRHSAVHDYPATPQQALRHPYSMDPAVGTTLKAKDIEKLTLKNLSQTGGQSIKALFFRQVRHLGETPKDQVEIALARMDTDLKLFVGNLLPPSPTLEDVEWALDRGFAGPRNMGDALRELYACEYHLADNPYERLHELQMKFELICTAFPNERRPNVEPIIKKIMMQHLPIDVKINMDKFTTDGVSLELFIVELERERANRKEYTAHIKASPETTTPYQPQPYPRPNQGPSQNRPQGNRPNPANRGYPAQGPSRPRQPRSYPCQYCRNGQHHSPRDCPREPPYGSCFYCLSTTHRRGDPACPEHPSLRPLAPNPAPTSA